MPLNDFLNLADALPVSGATVPPQTAVHRVSAPFAPPEEDESPGTNGARTLLHLSRTNSGHSESSGPALRPSDVVAAPLRPASSASLGAAALLASLPIRTSHAHGHQTQAANNVAPDPRIDLDAYIAFKVQLALRDMIPSIVASVQASMQPQIAAQIDQATAALRADYFSLETKARDSANQLAVVRNDLKTIFMTAVRDDDILAKKIEELGRLAASLQLAVDQTRREFVANRPMAPSATNFLFPGPVAVPMQTRHTSSAPASLNSSARPPSPSRQSITPPTSTHSFSTHANQPLAPPVVSTHARARSDPSPAAAPPQLQVPQPIPPHFHPPPNFHNPPGFPNGPIPPIQFGSAWNWAAQPRDFGPGHLGGGSS